MKKLHILCDLDSTVVDLFDLWLNRYNNAYNDNLTTEGVLSFDIEKYVKPECGEKIYEFLDDKFFLDVKPYEGALEAVEELTKSHRVHIVTAFSADKPETATSKVVWVRKHMPFIHKRFITLMSQKHMLRADVLIDDRPDTATACRETAHGKDMFLATVAFPFNKVAEPLYNCYAQSWSTPKQAWERIIKDVQAWAERLP